MFAQNELVRISVPPGHDRFAQAFHGRVVQVVHDPVTVKGTPVPLGSFGKFRAGEWVDVEVGEKATLRVERSWLGRVGHA